MNDRHIKETTKGIVLGYFIIIILILELLIAVNIIKIRSDINFNSLFGSLFALSLGILFLLSYFYKYKSFVFKVLMWFCEHISQTPGKKMAFIWFAIFIFLGIFGFYNFISTQ